MTQKHRWVAPVVISAFLTVVSGAIWLGVRDGNFRENKAAATAMALKQTELDNAKARIEKLESDLTEERNVRKDAEWDRDIRCSTNIVYGNARAETDTRITTCDCSAELEAADMRCARTLAMSRYSGDPLASALNRTRYMGDPAAIPYVGNPLMPPTMRDNSASFIIGAIALEDLLRALAAQGKNCTLTCQDGLTTLQEVKIAIPKVRRTGK